MKSGASPLLMAAAIAVATALLYGWRLQDAPIYVSPDEAIISVDAHSLASTGYDVHGRFLPLYFQVQLPGETRMGWFTPAIFYLSALVLKVLPFSEAAIRVPTVLVAVADVVLIYFVGRRLFRRESPALLAAAMLATTPAHFILGRYALDYLYPLPFVLGWLLCLLVFLDTERIAWLVGAGFVLGLGFFSYIAAVVMMPLYLLVTCAMVSRSREPLRRCAAAALGFAVPLLMLVPWLIHHPTAVVDTIDRYALYDTKSLNALQGARAFLSYPNLERMSASYWSFFSPSFLFFSGDKQMTFSTRSVGVFLFPIAVLLVLGIRHVLTGANRPAARLVLIGFATAPAAALLGSEDGVITRAVELLPFTVLLATFGVEYLWSTPIRTAPRALLLAAGAVLLTIATAYGGWSVVSRARVGGSTVALGVLGAALLIAAALSDRVPVGRLAACCLLAWIPIQFSAFGRDYFTDYRLRSGFWLGGNLRGALEDLIEMERRDHAPRIYFSTLASTSGLMDIRNRWMGTYWQFYLIKHRRLELLDRSAPLDLARVGAMPAGSLVLANVGEVHTESLVRAGDLTQVRVVPEVSGPPFLAILKR
jgi:4-amino-4-deoxy-L-arabinose transferase-like glycosyltransferase